MNYNKVFIKDFIIVTKTLPVSISMKDLNVSVMTDFPVTAKFASISKSVSRMNSMIVTSTVSVLILMEGENFWQIFFLVLNKDFQRLFHFIQIRLRVL